MIDERIKKIAEHYGFEAQADKSIEELADVKIMIDQLYFMSNFDGDVSKEIDRKLDRQMKRIQTNN